MKPLLIHYPQHFNKTSQVGRPIVRFYARLLAAMDELGQGYELIDRKDRELRKSRDFRHVIYHTHRDDPDVMNVKIGYLSDYFYFDEGGYSGWSRAAKAALPDRVDMDSAERVWQELQARYVATGRSKFMLPARIPAPLPRDYTAVFLQVTGDSVLRFAHMSSAEMVSVVLDAADGPVVIKRHPVCSSDESRAIIDDALRSGRDVHETDRTVHEIIAGARRVVCINSGTGFEALLHLKPVITCGRSDYHHAVTEVRSASELAAAMGAPAEPERIKRFLSWYLTEQMLPVDSPDFTACLARKLRAKGWMN